MNTLNVTLPENLQLQIILLAAHDGVTPSQYVAAALAEKVREVEDAGEVGACGRRRCAESVSRTLTIIPLLEPGTGTHDHLTPYHQA